jgi:heptosyltransferase-2
MHVPPAFVLARPDRVGDVILSSSCLPAVRSAFPDHALYVLAAPAMECLFEEHPLLAGFIPFRNDHGVWRRFSGLRQRFQSLHPEILAALHPDFSLYAAARFSKIPRRLGWESRACSWMLTDSLPYMKSEGRKHEAEYNFDVLKPLGVSAPESLRPSLSLASKYRDSLLGKLSWRPEDKPFIALHPSAFSPVARWPSEHFAELSRRIESSGECSVAWIGGDAADPSLREIRALLGSSFQETHNLCGKLNLAELGWLLSQARALVSRDTGPVHLAAAVDCPSVVIFGRSTPLYGPVRWKPLSGKTTVLASRETERPGESRTAFWRRSFASISVDDVEIALRQQVAFS